VEGNGTNVYVSALAVIDESKSFLFVVDCGGGGGGGLSILTETCTSIV